MNNPKITIVTVVYNGAETIERAIKSVISQNYEYVEYIIVDGGSTDGTLDIVNKYRDSISCIISEPDEGIYDAMNKGIRLATGDIIAFLGSDDWYLDGALEYVAEQFNENLVDMLWTRVLFEENNGLKESKAVDLAKLDYCMPGCHQGLYVSTQLFRQYGVFDTKYRIASDYDWIYKVLSQGVSCQKSERATCVFFCGGVSSVCLEEMYREQMKIALNYATGKQGKEYIKLYYEEVKKKLRLAEAVKKNQYIELPEKIRSMLCEKEWILFGIGNMSEECEYILKTNFVSIKKYVDNNSSSWGNKLRAYSIVAPKEIDVEKDFILITSLDYEQQIYMQLLQMGMKEEQIVLYSTIRRKVLEIMS